MGQSGKLPQLSWDVIRDPQTNPSPFFYCMYGARSPAGVNQHHSIAVTGVRLIYTHWGFGSLTSMKLQLIYTSAGSDPIDSNGATVI